MTSSRLEGLWPISELGLQIYEKSGQFFVIDFYRYLTVWHAHALIRNVFQYFNTPTTFKAERSQNVVGV